MSRMFGILWKVLQWAAALVLAFLLGCNLYLIGMKYFAGAAYPTIFGYSTAVIVSGSMEPALSVDDLILNHAQNSYEKGDIITFRSGNSLTTHRIVDVTDEGYITQGDANNAADLEPVPAESVLGRVVKKIPRIGRVLAFLKTPLGMTVLVFAGILILEFPFPLSNRREHVDEEGPDEQ